MSATLFSCQALSRYHLNDPMRLIIAIVLGTLVVQGAPFELGLRQGYADHEKDPHRDDETALLQLNEAFYRSREKRTVGTNNPQRYTNSRRVKIFNPWTKHFLQVSQDGKVNGTENEASANVLFRIESYATSKVRLLNVAHKRYVAINHKGVVISQKHMTDKSLFHHYRAVDHDRFSSTLYPTGETKKRDKWLLTLKKSGRVKNAKRTDPHMKAARFLVIPTDDGHT